MTGVGVCPYSAYREALLSGVNTGCVHNVERSHRSLMAGDRGIGVPRLRGAGEHSAFSATTVVRVFEKPRSRSYAGTDSLSVGPDLESPTMQIIARSSLSFVVALFLWPGVVSAQEDTCAWIHWATPWGHYNLGDDVNPPNGHFPANNWDYTFSQVTALGTTQDTPDASNYALHWFLDAQPPEFPDGGDGSGGVYQEIPVTPGVPIEYSFWWKGAQGSSLAWFEFVLIDGPFTT